jgi:uncharacterized SAM-binding protein YcdF (DUF218 family)
MKISIFQKVMDAFLLKKIVSAAIMPFSLILLLLLVSIIFYKKSPTTSYKSLLAGFILLFICSFPPFADWVMRPIESQYPAYVDSKQSIAYIVILGGYHVNDHSLPATSQLATYSLQRLIEGIRILKLHPEAQLITSGGAFNNELSNAQTMKLAAISLGVPESKILTENFPKDTEEEAQLIAPRIQGTHSVLVTNADHMPRAIKYFNQYGAYPVAAPVDTWIKNDNKAKGWDYYLPSARKLQQTTIAWYEILGRTAQWFKQLW